MRGMGRERNGARAAKSDCERALMRVLTAEGRQGKTEVRSDAEQEEQPHGIDKPNTQTATCEREERQRAAGAESVME